MMLMKPSDAETLTRYTDEQRARVLAIFHTLGGVHCESWIFDATDSREPHAEVPSLVPTLTTVGRTVAGKLTKLAVIDLRLNGRGSWSIEIGENGHLMWGDAEGPDGGLLPTHTRLDALIEWAAFIADDLPVHNGRYWE